MLQRQPASTAVVNTSLPLSHRSFSPAPAGSANALCERSWWAATPNVFHPRRCSYRSPGPAWASASLESVDGWPLATPDTLDSGGSCLVGSAVRRRRPRGQPLHPKPHGAADPRPRGDPGPDSCDRTGARGEQSKGAIGWSSASLPVRRGDSGRPGAHRAPS
ncbi:hypothetical protein N7493_009387 [Penicillium malachiteum]|uniref:Uncharacterized protein n=1 Tax=Penicillium malachiteum TaxID=1324776 RepID=A0AAD6HF09_9EURO|nr:hypothetical protein N7493_009387 [Penicillium malachiteum]